MAKQIQPSTLINVKIEQIDRINMEASFEKKNNPTVEALTTLIEHPSTDENNKIQYIYKPIYINYEKKNWINVIQDIEMYQEITKSKKLELLKIKSEIQQYCCKARLSLIALTNNDMEDNIDEHEHFVFAISQKNVDDFNNARFTKKSNKKQAK